MMILALLSLLMGFSEVPGNDSVRVMSYNIRYGSANDGVNAWPKRKDFLVETIKAFDPDLLGTQETLAGQRDDLSARLEGYGVVGVGRVDGQKQGEMMALFYRKARFELLAEGHFWLSETPDRVGSKSWDSSLPRMVTWVRLRDRKNPEAKPVVFFNTHFDHRGTTARLESARLIRKQIESLAEGCRVVLTGDFNCGEGSRPYNALFGPGEQPAARTLVDSYRVAHPTRAKGEGTFTNFNADATSNERIDWIGCSPDWTVQEAAIHRVARDGRTPSDHHAVTVTLKP